MTLIVSLRTPDGIVIAADSMSTMLANGTIEIVAEIKCPKCGHQHQEQIKIPMPPIPSTTFSSAQKLFPFLKRYGIGTFGAGMLMGKSAYYIVREFEQEMTVSSNLQRIGDTKDVAQEIGNHMHDLLEQQMKSQNQSVTNIPDNKSIIGFQVVGYDEREARTYEVNIGKKVIIKEHHAQGSCTVSGQNDVVTALWSKGVKTPFGQFSLQDAIAYVEFLINTTAVYQQFSGTIPGVGGDIDIALITTFNGFQWIRQKPLGKVLNEV